MIYTDHGMYVPQDTAEMDEYLAADNKLNNSGVRYLMMANALVHELKGATIADEFTNFPSLCEPIDNGGLGFDIRQASALPQGLRTLLKTSSRTSRPSASPSTTAVSAST